MSAVLEVKKLTKYYDKNHIILNQINFQLQKGEVVVILGSSGCGKSTFLRCLNGLENIQEGEIFFNGKKITPQTNWNAIRQKIGMVFQNYELFPHMNVLENIMLAPIKVQKRSKGEVRLEALKLLERVGLSKKQNAFPKDLSGGQKQRVAIVRALCMKPEIMLFDEVTASLDPEMVKEVLEVILELAKKVEGGMSMIIVTHEMKFASACADRIVFLDEGAIIEEANPRDFFTLPKTDRAKKFLNIFNFLGNF